MKVLLVIVFATSVLSITPYSSSHPFFQPKISHSGGTDKCGCHYNRETGEYHCHKRKKRGGDCPE